MRRLRRRIAQITVLLLLVVGGFLFWQALQAPGGRPHYVRIDHPTPLRDVLTQLETEGTIKSARAAGLLASLLRRGDPVPTGTYEVSGAKPTWRNLAALGHPIRKRFRFPETNWSKRNANLLQKAQIAKADDYLKEVANPTAYKADFPLPSDTLEGYLFPDTYDLPPLLGARNVVERQLEAFRRKVWEPLKHPSDLHHILILASLVELESGTDADRPMIAGVIENRLRKGMRLQIDASLLYGMGKWRTLTFKDYKEFDSPYNLYRVAGLPPTPICSPSLKSIQAAMAPARHNYLYYVALPNGTSLFAATYEEHKKNIKKRKAALEAEGR